jgi:hypothetical protein
MGYFSNGTEGEMFEDAWCSRCVHSDISGDREIGVDPPCPVWMAHTLYAYDLCNEEEHPGKVILDMLIPSSLVIASDGLGAFSTEAGCKMFHPIDAGAAIRGQLTLVARAALSKEEDA